MSPKSPTKRIIPGLAKRVAAFRAAAGLSINVASVQSGISVVRWRDAELFGLATDTTIAQLAQLGVDVNSLEVG